MQRRIGLLFFSVLLLTATVVSAAEPTLDQRVADLEAYMNNTARVTAVSKVAGPGPGHNGWMMVSTA